MTDKPNPELEPTPLTKEGAHPARFTFNGKFTAVKFKNVIGSVVGSIFKFDSLFKVVLGGAMIAGGTVMVGESASAWDIIDTEPAIEVIAIVQEDDGEFTLIPVQDASSILLDILTAAQNPIIVQEVGRDAEIISLLQIVLARLVPPGPPILPIVQENNCLLRSGKPCPQP